MQRKFDVPRVYGTGLISLDVVYGLQKCTPKYQVGGTCGNVLSILGFLGWDSYPISRLDTDRAGNTVRSDFAQCGVHSDYLGLQPAAATPIIIEQIAKMKDGRYTHRFQLACPSCGRFFPPFKPLRNKMVSAFLETAETPSVFFADRISKGIVAMATHFAERGALIVFEPCGTGDEKSFRQMCRLCHILKYSQERARTFVDVLKGAEPLLQVETLGDDGIRFRSNLPVASTSGWVKVDALEVDGFKDAAGAGDWASAALIDFLGRSGLEALEKTGQEQLLKAVQYAQVLASWNCKYEGARGGMYESTWESLQHYVEAASLRTRPLITRSDKMDAIAVDIDICVRCGSNSDVTAFPSSDGPRKRQQGERNRFRTVA